MDDASRFHLPDLGEGLTEAEIVAWHVGVGDNVVADQPLVAVETDKAVVEIPAPRAGRIKALHGAVGDRIPVGAPLVEFATTTGDRGALVGELAEPPPTPAPATAPTASPTSTSASAGRVAATPAVRRLARTLEIDLARVTGTGPDGTISSADVRAAALLADRSAPNGGTRLHGARRAMAARMADAHARVVPATVTAEADIHAWAAGTAPMPRLIRAIGAAVRVEPRLNAAFDDTSLTLRANAQVDLGIAMETEEGLFVPVLRNIEALTGAALAAALATLEADVQARQLPPDALRGQTITLSNFGAVAGLHATMVVVPPQVAIVGAGRARPQVVAAGDQAVVHRLLPLSITIDHRAITGVEACRFLAALIADLESAT